MDEKAFFHNDNDKQVTMISKTIKGYIENGKMQFAWQAQKLKKKKIKKNKIKKI